MVDVNVNIDQPEVGVDIDSVSVAVDVVHPQVTAALSVVEPTINTTSVAPVINLQSQPAVDIDISSVSVAADIDNVSATVALTSYGGGGGVTDHAALTGLTDDDHSIYAFLAGRADGQTFQEESDSANLLKIGYENINNLESTPAVVRVGLQVYPVTQTGVNESAAIYGKLSGAAQQQAIIYSEITSAQQDTYGAAWKGIHYGSGDFGYIACFSDGPSWETASFYNGSRGFISTCQWEAENGDGSDFGNTTLYNAVWGYDGTGGSTTPPNFGIYYASLSLGNSFRTQLQDPDATGFAWGRTEIAISEYGFARDRFQVYNTGQVRMLSTSATAGATTKAAPAIQLYGSFYTGGAAADRAVLMTPGIDGSGNPSLALQMGAAGSEATVYSISAAQATFYQPLDLQNQNVSNAGSITSVGSATIAAAGFYSFTGRAVLGSAASNSLQIYQSGLGDYATVTAKKYIATETLSLWGAAGPVAQPSHIANPTDLATCITSITSILSALESYGMVANS